MLEFIPPFFYRNVLNIYRYLRLGIGHYLDFIFHKLKNFIVLNQKLLRLVLETLFSRCQRWCLLWICYLIKINSLPLQNNIFLLFWLVNPRIIAITAVGNNILFFSEKNIIQLNVQWTIMFIKVLISLFIYSCNLTYLNLSEYFLIIPKSIIWNLFTNNKSRQCRDIVMR